MTRAMVPVRRATRAIERYQGSSVGIDGWGITGIVAAVLVGFLIAVNAKDIARYIKISSM